MRIVTLVAVVGLAAIALGGCGKYHGKYGSKYYKDNAQALAPITVPHGVVSPVGEQFYAIPWKAKAAPNKELSMLPPDPAFLKKYNELNTKVVKK